MASESKSTSSQYTDAYFAMHESGAVRSARAIVPLVIDLIHPRSVVDVGCGTGAWLSVVIDSGVDDVLGVDGAYVDPARLLIPAERFVAHDLETPLELGRRFELALSLEVAEHLPASSGSVHIKSLVDLAPVVLFSAAVPGQGGIGHVNEQWQDYWAGLFAEHNYVPVDAIRPVIWKRQEVEPWYAQNVLLYVARDVLAQFPRLEAEAGRNDRLLRVVHPEIFAIYRPAPVPGTADLIRELARALRRWPRDRFAR